LILIKRSDISGFKPALSSLDLGELGVNTADGKLFLKTEVNSITSIKTFLNNDDQYFIFDKQLSSVNTQHGNNTVTEVFGSVFGGYNNDISGGASTVINGEDNDISGNFSLIGTGLNNKISLSGDYSFIAGGQNNLIQHENVFTLGSNISSHSNNFTYVNNISATGKLYGDGSELIGIISGDSEATTLVRSNSANWEFAYNVASAYVTVSSTFLTSETDSQTLSFNEGTKELSISNGNFVSLSALIDDTGIDTSVRNLTANWESTYTTVQTNSASWDATYESGSDLEVRSLTGIWDSTFTTVSSNSANWNYRGTDIKELSGNWQSAYAYVSANSVNLTANNIFVTNDLTVFDTISSKYYQGTVIDWMSLVRGYKTTPTLLETIAGGEVYQYVYTTTGTDKTYYRYIATDGSEDSFYGNFNNPTLSNLIATKAIIL